MTPGGPAHVARPALGGSAEANTGSSSFLTKKNLEIHPYKGSRSTPSARQAAERVAPFSTKRRCLALLGIGVRLALSWPGPACAGEAPAATHLSAEAVPRAAQLYAEIVSKDTFRVANWVVASSDNRNLPFIIVDKVQAKIYVFDGGGRLLGATLVLLGKARGDDSAPGIGTRTLAAIPSDERTTPAGRFVAFLGRDFQHDLLWIDYALSLSLHRVITGSRGDHRLQRLATLSPLDKRISFGCINVPVKFYEQIVLGAFKGTRGIVYILPEVKTLRDVFHMPEPAER
jgi:hypothetical protein